MSMKASFDIANPNKVEMRMTVVMTVEDWGKVRGALKEADEQEHWHPANQLVRSIDDLTSKANKDFMFWGEDAPEEKQP